MWPLSSHSAADGCYRSDDLVEWGEEFYGALTVYPHFSRSTRTDDTSIQPIAPGGQDISTRYLPFFFSSEPLSYGVPTAGVSTKAPASANLVQSPTLDSGLSQQGPGGEAQRSYTIPVTDGVYQRAEVGPPTPQQPADSVPGPQSYAEASDYVGSSILLPHGTPPTRYDHAERQPPSLSPHIHDSYHKVTPSDSDSDATYLPHRTANNFLLPLDYTSQTTRVVVRVNDPSGSANPPVPGPPSGMGNGGMTGQPMGPSQLGTDNVEPRNPRKRKRVIQDDPRNVNRIRHWNPQHLDPPPIRVTPFLLGRPDLRRVQQVGYRSRNPQDRWTKLPDIDFSVKGIEGIRLSDAIDIYFDGPDGRDDLMFANGNIKGSVSCRIIFDGCQSFVRQIVTTNHKMTRDRTTKKKLAYHIAKRIEAYLKELKDARTPFHIDFKDMFLTKFIHVARASWQPEIWYQVSTDT